ncbi:hypothetical protein [Streptomyces sp. cg35]|uniref:hypothetical protein n=1 Tax=Streptomyces sp. cg35 TaxID=3421650 RepID=UPI003D16F4EF
MSKVSVKALVRIDVDGQWYGPGEWIVLPEEQKVRADALVAYGLAELAPVAPVKKARRTTGS